jgi:hypothetical protein
MVEKLMSAPKKRKFDQEQIEDLSDDLSIDTLDALTKVRAKATKRSKVDRTSYPEDAKAHYLKLKKLYIKKLKLASHIRETTNQLKEAKYPNVIDFKCAPLNAGGDLDYLTEWASIVVTCKKDLTLLYLDHLKAIPRMRLTLISFNWKKFWRRHNIRKLSASLKRVTRWPALRPPNAPNQVSGRSQLRRPPRAVARTKKAELTDHPQGRGGPPLAPSLTGRSAGTHQRRTRAYNNLQLS